MRGVACLTAAAFLATASTNIGVGRAAESTPPDPTILLFSGFDLWRHGGFAHGGVLWSPGGLEREGFTFKLLVGGGTYQYISGALGNVDVEGRQLVAFALPGWRFKSGRTEITVFGGLDVQDHKLRPDDVSTRLRGTILGVRGGFDLWHEPGPTTMAAVNASLSTVGSTYSVRGAVGWKFVKEFYVGPEAQAFGSDNYRQFRLGLHLTALKTEVFEWSAGFGWTRDSDDRDGAYGRIGVLARR